jgi:hypothetical protein
LGAVVFGPGLFGQDLKVVRRTLHLPRWDADGFRVVQISDVHVNNSGLLEVAKQAAQVAAAEKPDLVVFTGDFVNDATPDCLANIVPAFEPLRDVKCPCLAIPGNHEYKSKGPEKIFAEVAKTRMRLLRNESVEVDGVTVTGLDDAIFGDCDPTAVPAGRRSNLVLLHEPDAVRDVPNHASLVLSGHSHGGEVCFPGGTPIFTPQWSRRYKAGYYNRPEVPLYVSRGTATLGPARVHCPPEVNILTLRGA